VSEHVVTRRNVHDLVADRFDDACRLDTERQRRLPADVPVADADDVVPVANARRANRDDDLVRLRCSRRWELEGANLAAECVDAGSLHF
jgi:hypothetical protein